MVSMRQLLPILIVSSLVLQSCGGGARTASPAPPALTETAAPATVPPSPAAPESDEDAAVRLAGVLRDPFSEASADAAAEAMARAGIAIHADDQATVLRAPSAPATGLRYTRFQARGMAAELAGHGGLSGAELNRLIAPIPLPDGSELPLSALVAAYVAEGQTFGAQLSRELLSDFDPKRHAAQVYPTLVLALFHRDVLLPMAAAAETSSQSRTAGPQLVSLALPFSRSSRASADPCGDVIQFMEDLPDAVEGAVRDALEGGWEPLVWAASNLAGLAAFLGVEAVRGLLQHNPAVEAIRLAFNTLGAAIDLTAMFSQWPVQITAAPAGMHKSVGGANNGVFTLTMGQDGNDIEWPQPVRSCAELFGIDLPRLDASEGASVTWTELGGFPNLAVQTGQQNSLSGGQATFDFTAATEDRDVHEAGGEEDDGPASVKADVALPGLQDLAERLASAMESRAAQVGVGLAAGIAAQSFGPSGTGSVTVSFHDEAQPASIRSITGTEDFEAVSCEGVFGTWDGTVTYRNAMATGSAPIQWTFDASGTATLNFTVEASGPVAKVTHAVTETLRLVTSDFGAAYVSSSGSYVDTFDLPEPAPDPPPISGVRAEDYEVILGPTPECE